MHRKPRSLFLPLTLGLIFSVPFIGCAGSSSGGSGGSSSGGKASGGSSGNGSGGSGNGGSGSGGTSAKGGSAGSNAGGSSSGGSGGNGAGGSGNGGSGAGGTSAKGGAGGGSSGAGGSAGGTSAGGAGAAGSGAGGSNPGGASGSNGCATDDTISNFEDGADPAAILPGTGITGTWEKFNDGGSGTETMKVESTGDSTDCHKYALHVTGSNWATYSGVGITNLAGGAKDIPLKIYPNTKSYTGIKFRAKVGASHPANSPVRFNISTPWTEGTSSGGTCPGKVNSTPTKAAVDCYQHVGRFMVDDYALTTSWKDITFCFDRDLYPLSLPTNLTNAQRDSVAKNMLKVQFQFNQAKDWTVASYPASGLYTAINQTTPYDLWIDDISFFTGDCPVKPAFQSSSGTAKTFPQNKAPSGGSCAIATNADKYNNAISQIYARWTKNFVRSDSGGLKVISPEQENGVTTSEGMGYGMMITAAMGDKDSFDKMWTYVQSKMSGGLMTWKTGGSGSASDGDEDITYALYMAAAQWGGSYKTAADAMAAAFGGDIANDVISGGNAYKTVFNPSYFAPAAYRKFAGGYASMITKTYGLVSANISAATAGLPTDWASPSTGAPKAATDSDVGASVTSGLDGGPVFGFDAARVPWRLGLDVCTGGAEGKDPLSKMVSFFATSYDSGDTIDFLKGGWVKSSGQPHAKSVDCQGSFIGPMGVAGMAVGGDTGNKFRDRAFRAILDIEDYGDFNHTYFPSTVGFLTLLLMSGNFPTP
jgi:hypothetical protein